MIFIAIVSKPWDGSASRFSDEEYKRSCLICEPNCTSGPKTCCHLPVKEPNGDINKNALSAALGALHGARSKMKISSSLKKTALSKLRGYYKQAGMDLKAAYAFKAGGRVWDAGLHNVWVNGNATRLWVPEETILETYDKLQSRLEAEGVSLGIDHLPPHVIEQNKILKKMDLLNVGTALKFGTDGKSIYMTDSEVTNQEIQKLGYEGELPSFSVVGPIRADKCSRDNIDLVLKSLDIKRIDFVEKGGCASCNVGETNEDMIILGKLSIEEDIMSENEMQAEEVEQTEAVEQTETKEEPNQETEVQAEESRMDLFEKRLDKMMSIVEKISTDEIAAEFAEVKKEQESMKLEAKKAEAKESVEKYIEAGIAVPAQREALEAIAVADPDGFEKLMASSPKILKFEQKSQHMEAEESEEKIKDDLTEYDGLTQKEIDQLIEKA